MGLGANLAGIAAKVGTVFNGIFGNNNKLEDQEELMRKAWEYEKAGMGLQYNYGQQAADAEYRRNLQMWKDTNFGAQRNEMEKAGLSVGLMYGNGGGQAASTAGGTATQPSAPKTNPIEVGLQQQALDETFAVLLLNIVLPTNEQSAQEIRPMPTFPLLQKVLPEI